MNEGTAGWPKKTREHQWAVWDSARLNDFPFRDDDIMICTWSKSGTTWTQQLVAQLVLKAAPDAYGQQLSPWIEFRGLPKEAWFEIAEKQTHRRFLKTHSRIDAIPFLPQLKYIYVGRDIRDVIFSAYHHHSSFTQTAYDTFNNTPDHIGGPMAPPGCDVRAYYRAIIQENRVPGFPNPADFWAHVQGYWDARHLPNLLFVHFANLKANFAGEARRIAGFLDIEVPEELWPAIIAHCDIDYMREQAAQFPMLERQFEGGGRTFINKGTNGRWKSVLSPEEIAMADEAAARNLSPDCAHWLKTGELPQEDR